jgi:hypothetical protein
VAKKRAQLDLPSDSQFQRLEWRAQRTGWVAWAVVVLAGGLGLLGPGWLSNRHVTSGDGRTRVAYERFLHYHHPTQLEVVHRQSTDAPQELAIRVSHALLDRMRIQRIEPEPRRQELMEDAVLYRFSVQPGPDEVKVVFHVEYERYGAVHGDLGIDGDAAVTLSQFVYP